MDTELPRPSTDRPVSIDMLSSTDIAYWCRVFDIDMTELRRAVEQGHKASQRLSALVDLQPTPTTATEMPPFRETVPAEIDPDTDEISARDRA